MDPFGVRGLIDDAVARAVAGDVMPVVRHAALTMLVSTAALSAAVAGVVAWAVARAVRKS